jgi:FtsX-like permease family
VIEFFHCNLCCRWAQKKGETTEASTFMQAPPIAFRQLLKSPGFSLAIVLTLAVGIGGTTAMFSLIEGILLRPCAILLAITGIYAVVAFSVSLRMREMAIRLTLGAHPRHLMRLVLKSGARLAFLGCVLGVLGSIAASRVVNSFLFGVSATDPAIYLAGVFIMMLMALVASALPAVRAAAADPIDALGSI